MIPDPPIFVDYGKGDHIIRPTAKTANFARSSAAAEIRHTGQSLQDLATAIKPVQMAMQPSQYAALGSAGRSEDEPSRKPTTPGRSRSQSHSSTRSARSRPASFKTADAHDDEDPDRTAQDISRPSSRAQSTSRTASRTTSPAPPQARPVHSPPAPESVPRSPATTSMRSEGGYGTAKPSRPTSVATKKVDPLEEGLAALRNPAKARELYDASPRASSRPASQGPTTVDLLRKKSSRSMYSPQAEAVPSPMQASSSQPGRSSADNRNRRVSQADMYVDRRYASPQQHQDYHGSTPISPHNIPAPASTHGSTSSGRVRASSPGPAVAAMMQPPSRSPSPRPDSTPKGELDPAAVVTSYGQAFPGEARRSRTSSFSDTGRPVSQASYHQTSSRPGSISNTAYQQAQQHHQRVASSSRAQSPSVYATQSPGGASSGIYQIQQPRQPGYYEHQPPSAAYSYNGSARTTSSDYRQSPVSPAQHSVSSQQFQPGLTPAQLYAQQASDQTQSDGIQRVASAASYGAHPPTTTSFSQSHTLTPDSAPHHGQQAGQMQSEPSRRAPSPAPAPQGRPVLFFGISFSLIHQMIIAQCVQNAVRAMYDYEAQDPEEFSFQANDIIAVHQTDSSGWWTGELLDENRRFLGRTIFPSNL